MRATAILLICVDSVEAVLSTRPVARTPKRKGVSVTNNFWTKSDKIYAFAKVNAVGFLCGSKGLLQSFHFLPSQ